MIVQHQQNKRIAGALKPQPPPISPSRKKCTTLIALEMRPKSQRRKNSPSKNQDRISMLSDEIIGEILSLIPTRQAVATSILSRRWRYLWTLTKNLDFNCLKPHEHNKDHTAFVKFVDTVFSKSTTRELQKLHLLACVCKSHVARWVNEAIIRNVKMLVLSVSELPGNVFECRSLTSLIICNPMETAFNAPDSICLPNLKVLKIGFPNELIGFVQKLVSHCPAIEDFYMSTEVGSQETFVISLPLLKRLEMDTSNYVYDEIGYTLVIDAPDLQSLEIRARGHVPSYLIKNVPSEVEAIIDVGEWSCEATEKETRCIVELLNQLHEVKFLTLEMLTLRYLRNADLELLPIFNKLTSLKLNIDLDGGSEIISDLLQASPILEILMVEMVDEDEGDLGFQWIEPEYVPACLSSCLSVF